jgi:hypothetical protein
MLQLVLGWVAHSPESCEFSSTSVRVLVAWSMGLEAELHWADLAQELVFVGWAWAV